MDEADKGSAGRRAAPPTQIMLHLPAELVGPLNNWIYGRLTPMSPEQAIIALIREGLETRGLS